MGNKIVTEADKKATPRPALPKGVTAKVDKNRVTLSSADRDLVGQTAAKVRELRPPEPYKGKGVKYVEEVIKRKVGKAGATSGS